MVCLALALVLFTEGCVWSSGRLVGASQRGLKRRTRYSSSSVGQPVGGLSPTSLLRPTERQWNDARGRVLVLACCQLVEIRPWTAPADVCKKRFNKFLATH